MTPGGAISGESRSIWRRALRVALIGTGAIAGLLAGFIVALQFDAVGTWLARTIAARVVPDSIDVSVERVSGSWLRSLNVVGVRLSVPGGDTVVSIDNLHASYRLLPLLRRRVDVRRLHIAAPRLRLARAADGSVGIEGWPQADTAPAETASQDGGWNISVGELVVERAAGRLTTAIDAFAWNHVDIALHDLIAGDRFALVLDSATGRVDVPTLPPEADVGPLEFLASASVANGRIDIETLTVDGPSTRITGAGNLALPDSTGAPVAVDFDLDVHSLPLAIVHAALGNPPDQSARLNATVDVNGTTALLTAAISANTSDGGEVHGTAAFAPAGRGDVLYRADLAITSLDPATLTGDTALAGAIGGTLDVDLEGPSRSALDGHAHAAFDRFAIGPASLRSARLESSWVAGKATVDLGIEGDDISASLAGTMRPLDAVPEYDVHGPFRFRLPGDTTNVVVLAGRITASGTGIDPASAYADVDVALSTIEIMTASLESGHIVASMDSGRVAFRLDARSSDDGRLAANGTVTLGDSIGFTVSQATVRDLDVAAFLGDTIPSRLDADFTASGVAGQPDLMLSDIQLTIREGRYGALVIDTMAVDARLAGGRLSATGRALSNAGRADFELSARPFAQVPSFDVDQFRFADVDLGVLSTDTTLSTSITGSVSGTGRGTSIEQLVLDLSIALDSSRVGRQVISNGQGTLVLLESRADVDLDVAFVDSGGIHIAMNGRPFAERPTFDISEADFRALDPFAFTGTPDDTGTPGDSSDARASLNGSIIATVEGVDPRTMVASGTLRLDASRIEREPISEGLVEWTLDDSLLDADATIDFATGRLTADAAVTFAEADMSYVLDAVLHSGGTVRLAGEDSVGSFVDATVSVEGRGTSLASMTTRIRATADSVVFGDLRVDTLRLAVLIDRGVATIDTLRINSNFAHVTGSGSMPVSDSAAAMTADLTIDGTIRSLDAVQRWLGIEPLGLGTGVVHFAVTGPADSLRVDATVAASAALFGRTRLIGLESSFQGYLGSGLRLASATGTIELDRLDFAGFEVRISLISGEWNGDELALEGEATIDDRRDLTFAMRVDPRIGAAYADLDRLDFRMDEDRWELTGTPTISWADGIRVDSLVLRANNQVIAVNGLLDTDDRSDLSVRIEQFRMGSVADLLGYDRLDGTLTASFGVQGPAASPRITGGIDARVDWQGGPESSVVATLTYDTLRLDLDASIRTDRGGALTIAGGLPIDLALTRTAEGDTARLASAAPGSVDLTIRADSFGIEWVEPFLDRSTARDFNGQLQIDAHVTGSQASPILSGSASLSNGRVTVPRLGVTYEDAVIGVSLDGNVARIDSARARTGDGTITLGGSVALPELSLGEFDIEAQLDEFRAIHNDAFRVSASGTASITGTTSEPRLVGNVDLVETDIRLDDRVSGASVRPVELTDEQVRELEDYFGLPILVERDPNALFEALAIDLDVSMSRDTWVRQRSNPKLEIQLTGDVRVTKEPQDSLRFNGRIEAVPQRSYVEQFGKRFAIETGVVELQGMVSEAQLDISAAYRVPSTRDPSVAEATITLGIEGTMSDLSLLLGSEPEMENADIVSYLATGRPAATSLDFGQSGGGGGIGSIGSDLALGQVTGLVEGLAAEGVGLDVIEIRPDGLRGATLIAGRYVTPRVYVGFKQPIGRDPDDADGRSEFERTEVELEYQAVRWLLLNMQASNSAVSFLFRFRHAY